MILYDLIGGEVLPGRIAYRPKTCFIMTQLGAPIPQEVTRIRRSVERYLRDVGIEAIDANTEITGKDFLLKIWRLIASVPLGIGIVTKDLSASTMANIFYEVGLLQALGRESLIIKGQDAAVPSDFVRTEYIEYPKRFKSRFAKFLKRFEAQADHYGTVAKQVTSNPLLAIDYLRRAYLISGSEDYQAEAIALFKDNEFDPYTTEGIQAFLAG